MHRSLLKKIRQYSIPAHLSNQVLAVHKYVAPVTGLMSSIKDLQLSMANVQTWRKATDTEQTKQRLRLTALETWRYEASPVVIQAVTTSRFEAFVSARFSEVEMLARGSLPNSVFNEFVATNEKGHADGQTSQNLGPTESLRCRFAFFCPRPVGGTSQLH